MKVLIEIVDENRNYKDSWIGENIYDGLAKILGYRFECYYKTPLITLKNELIEWEEFSYFMEFFNGIISEIPQDMEPPISTAIGRVLVSVDKEEEVMIVKVGGIQIRLTITRIPEEKMSLAVRIGRAIFSELTKL